MKTLFIDTHLSDINIIIFDNDKIVKSGQVKNQKYNSVFLMPTIKSVCDNQNFDQIVIVNGPGSFTGVRLGVTIAKTLAYTMNKPIKPISYFDLLNYSSDDNHHVFGISDGNGYFIAEYQNHILIDKYQYLNNSEYQYFSKNKTIETDVSINHSNVL